MSAAGDRHGLTPSQARVRAFVLDFQRRHGVGPRYADVMAGLSLRSKATVHGLVERLAERGHVVVAPGRTRSLRVIEHVCPHCGGDLSAAPLRQTMESGG